MDFLRGILNVKAQVPELLFNLNYLDVCSFSVQLLDTFENGIDDWPPAFVYVHPEKLKGREWFLGFFHDVIMITNLLGF